MQAPNGRPQRADIIADPASTIQSNERNLFGEQNKSSDLESRDNATSSLTRHPAEYECSGTPAKEERKPPLTIKELREAAQGAAQNNPNRNASKKKPELPNNVLPVQQKKKGSLFGGLFQVKEPTQVALNQVAAQMMAQHGSISPARVPHVRLEKMPEHVPKVNTKWDGVPEVVKQREKREKELAKASKKDLFSLDVSRSGSSGREDDSRRRFDSRNSSSTTGSFSSRGRSIGSNGKSARNRFYAQSANSSGDLASQQRADRAKQHGTSVHSHSASVCSLPESAVETIPDIPDYLREAIVGSKSTTKPSREDGLDQSTQQPSAPMRAPGDPKPSLKIRHVPGVDDVPTHSTSPLPSPHDMAPSTPLPLQPGDTYHFRSMSPNTELASPLSPGPGNLASTNMPKRKPPPIMTPGFLAGEAQELVLPNDDSGQTSTDLPLRSWQSGHTKTAATSDTAISRVQQGLERRPDSSRARLGLRASMLLRDDENPWELIEQQALSLPGARSPRTPTSPRLASSPRGKFSKGFGIFNKEKDRP